MDALLSDVSGVGDCDVGGFSGVEWSWMLSRGGSGMSASYGILMVVVVKGFQCCGCEWSGCLGVVVA